MQIHALLHKPTDLELWRMNPERCHVPELQLIRPSYFGVVVEKTALTTCQTVIDLTVPLHFGPSTCRVVG
jgi:hypothetical protein